jgi:hypothetical protein
MTPHEKYSALKYLEMAWEEVNKIATPTPCTACVNWEFPGLCKLCKMAIPADILYEGCKSWKFDPTSPPF